MDEPHHTVLELDHAGALGHRDGSISRVRRTGQAPQDLDGRLRQCGRGNQRLLDVRGQPAQTLADDGPQAPRDRKHAAFPSGLHLAKRPPHLQGDERVSSRHAMKVGDAPSRQAQLQTIAQHHSHVPFR
jgi:hypothetical protein